MNIFKFLKYPFLSLRQIKLMPPAMIWQIALLLGSLQMTFCAREHKVHNIVLYPDRHSWCQTTAIKQIVASPGYESVTIDNNVCVGACYSYSIPRTQPAEPGELIGPYCDSCQPVGTRCYHVTLKADDKNTEVAQTIQKRVQIITNCSCMSCDTVQNKDCEDASQNTSELPLDLFALLRPFRINKTNPEVKSPLEEVPELLNFTPPETNASINLNIPIAKTDEQRHQLNTKLINLLKNIQEEGEDSPNFRYDKEQLKQLLDIIEDSKYELSDQNLIELVNFVNIHNSENLELDLSKLKEVLLNFKKNQEITERHRSFGLGNLEQGEQNNEKIESDLENLSKTIGLPNGFGIEGSHHGLGSNKGAHIGMGLVDDEDNSIENLDNENNEESTAGHHYLGEPQHIGIDVGHLVRGPHGSLSFAPDAKVEHKLNIEADMVKPNQEGLILSYENQPKRAAID